MESVEFRLLGPVGVWRGDTRLGPATAQQRAVLAVLLFDPGRVVPTDRLVTALWDGAPPASARNALQVRISALRRLLAPLDEPVPTSSRGGYLLSADPRRVDLHRFRELVGQAREERADRPERASGLLQAALALWRGPALADVGGAWLPGTVSPALDAERLDALEERVAIDLDLGRHQEVAAELPALVSQHPLREPLAGLMMSALHADGRRDEALTVFHDLSQRLATELGIEPGEELRRRHRAVLAPAPRSGPGGPRHLPPGGEPFTGRAAQLAALEALVPPPDTGPRAASGAAMTCVITGTGGVGKTALALHWARRAAGRFPHGQLYLDLRGFGPAGPALPPDTALRALLEALGVPQNRIPGTLDARAGLYRDLTAGRRLLVLLDNARDTEQVRPLLPSSRGCLVLVTSRNELTGLVAGQGAHALPLGLLSAAESRELLVRRLGPGRVGAERQAADDIVSRCAGLPLALAIVAARALTRPAFPLAALVPRAYAADPDTEPGDALDQLDGGDAGTNLRTVFSWSYQALSPAAARMFRLLGLPRGPELSLPAAASLAGLPPRRARHLLAELVRAHLVNEHSPDRYSRHDLLWLYASERAQTEEPTADRLAALHRLFDHYLHSALPAAGFLEPHYRPDLAPPPPATGVTVEHQDNAAGALAWFARERPTLLATVRQATSAGSFDHAWRLAVTARVFLARHGHSDDQAALFRLLLDTAGRLSVPDGPVRAHAHFGLGQALIRLGRHDEGHRHLDEARQRYAALGDPTGQAMSHTYLAALHDRLGDHPAGLRHSERALVLWRAVGHRVGEAQALNNVGWFHAHHAQYGRALRCCLKALAVQEELGAELGQAGTLDSLGHIHHRVGLHTLAISYYERALVRLAGRDRVHETETLARLAEAQFAVGNQVAARAALHRALATGDSLGWYDTTSLRARLTLLNA